MGEMMPAGHAGWQDLGCRRHLSSTIVCASPPRERAYARTYQKSEQRRRDLRFSLYSYKTHRPLIWASPPPITRSDLDRNNLLSLHI